MGPKLLARRMVDALPPGLVGRLDLLRPSLRQAWGGPLNGQAQRQTIVRSLAASISFDAVLETGTYRGTTTAFFSEVFQVPVETVESSRRFFAYSKARLSRDPRITVSCDDSRAFLRRSALIRSEQTLFIYLDAHWEEDLPLREELEAIRSSWSRAVVMIDDFAVPHDPGYGYDDYGPGKALREECLPPLPGWLLCYPSAKSAEETGKKRGCAVLFSPDLATVRVAELAPSRTL